MPRIRTIKPEFWSSPSTAKASLLARLAYIGMWNWADDHGRGTLNYKELEGFIFPNDDLQELASELPSHSVGTSYTFRDTVKEVSDVFGVQVYTVHGRRYYAIPTWNEHQRTERKAKSKFPGPEMADDQGSDGTSYTFRRTAQETPSQDKDVPALEQGNRGTGEQGKRGKETEETGLTPSLDELAAAYAATEHAPNVYGSAADPRCGKHKNLPADKVPNCHECAQARHWFETNAATQIDARRQARREAIDACNECDDNGWLTTPSGVIRCNHQPAKKAGPY